MNNNNAYKLRIPLLPKTTEETAVSPKHLTQPIGSTGFLALILKDDWHWICVQNTVRQDTGTSSNGNYWITGWSSSCPSSRLLGIVPQAQWRDVWEAAECAGWVHSPHGLLLGELEATRVNEPSRPICVPQGFAHQVGSRKAQAHNLQECRLPDHSLVCHKTPLGNVPTYLHPIQQTHSLVRCWITTQTNRPMLFLTHKNFWKNMTQQGFRNVGFISFDSGDHHPIPNISLQWDLSVCDTFLTNRAINPAACSTTGWI